ncbi:MAG: phosphatidylglycerophosphatase A [Alphaproteobacteria bacterium]|nr:phosphatidylglycerophosphatase A [Alphaproteobacteria bacterium]
MTFNKIQDKLKAKIQKVSEQRKKFISQLNVSSPEFQIATWFGSGLLIPAPGTWGTIGGGIFGVALLYLTSPIVTLLVSMILTAIGYWSIKKIEKQTEEHDSSFIVIDEVVAILMVFALMPNPTWIMTLLAFVIFRFFDALKPWPINWLDKHIQGAAGVIIDDLMAGLYTLLILWGIHGFI